MPAVLGRHARVERRCDDDFNIPWPALRNVPRALTCGFGVADTSEARLRPTNRKTLLPREASVCASAVYGLAPDACLDIDR
jgi:hypothetical protein